MGNTTELKNQNILDIIRFIKIQKKATKPEIARAVGLTTVTVHNFVNELVACGICTDIGSSSSNGGRKATLYRINENYGYLMGLMLNRTFVSFTLHDLDLNQVYYKKIPCNPDKTSQTIALMVENVQNMMKESGVSQDQVLGLGITVPGKVDQNTGIIIQVPDIPNWNSVPLRNEIESKIGIRCFANNDINARTLSAKWQGTFGENAEAVLINFTVGVGMGIMAKGKLLYGIHSYAGEIGHTTISYNGPLCACGNRGCIEALTSNQVIIEKVLRIHDLKFPGIGEMPNELTIDDVIRLAKDPDNQSVYNILRETAFYISIGLEHVVKLYDPEIIIFQNNWLNAFPDLYYYMIESLFSRCPWVRRDSIKIHLDSDDIYEESSAACLVLEEALTYTPNNVFIQHLQMCIEKQISTAR